MKNPAAHNKYLLQAELVLLTVRISLNTNEECTTYDPKCSYTTITGYSITQKKIKATCKTVPSILSNISGGGSEASSASMPSAKENFLDDLATSMLRSFVIPAKIKI